MQYDLPKTLEILKPGAQWVIKAASAADVTYASLDWKDESQTKPTETELNNKLSELNNAEPLRLLRVERDKRLTETDWVVAKATETGGTVSDAWKTYRQALRDLPASASPKLDSFYELDLTSVTWPTKPS